MKRTTYIVTAIEHDESDLITLREIERDKNAQPKITGMAAEKPVGALCYLPKSIHRLMKRYAKDRDITVKRFILETLLIGLEQQAVITREQHVEVLKLPNEYGWKGRQ